MAADSYIYEVPIGQPTPEFSVSIYDNSDYSMLRPLYNGNPVLSTITVDSVGTSGTEQMGDIHFYNYGTGPSSRIVYTQIDCNIDVQVPSTPINFNTYMSNQNPVLRIYKVSTGDLLIEETLGNREIVNGKYRYKTSFTFSEEWGDGELLLIDIFLNMRIYTFLPITFSIGDSGTNEQPLFNIFSE